MRKKVAIGAKHGQAKGLFAFKAVIKRSLGHIDIPDNGLDTRREIARFGQNFKASANQRLARIVKMAIDLGWTAAAGLQDGGGIGIHHLDRVV